MSPTAALCPVHGAVDVGWAIQVGEGSTVTLSGNVASCPHCGRPARMIDGTFRGEAGGILTPIDAPAWSRQALDAVQEPLLRAAAALADRSITEPKALRHVYSALLEIRQEAQQMRQENEKAAQLLTDLVERLERQTRGKNRWKAGAIFAGVAMVLGFAVDTSVAFDAAPDVIRAVQEIVEGFQSPEP